MVRYKKKVFSNLPTGSMAKIFPFWNKFLSKFTIPNLVDVCEEQKDKFNQQCWHAVTTKPYNFEEMSLYKF